MVMLDRMLRLVWIVAVHIQEYVGEELIKNAVRVFGLSVLVAVYII